MKIKTQSKNTYNTHMKTSKNATLPASDKSNDKVADRPTERHTDTHAINTRRAPSDPNTIERNANSLFKSNKSTKSAQAGNMLILSARVLPDLVGALFLSCVGPLQGKNGMVV